LDHYNLNFINSFKRTCATEVLPIMSVRKRVEVKRSASLLLFQIILIILPVLKAHSQEITRTQANSLVIKLNRETTDTGRFKLLVELAWFQVLKRGEFKTDLDSARTYLTRAHTLLPHPPLADLTGFFDMVYSDYCHESGQKKLSHNALESAIGFLKQGKNKFLLGCAYRDSMYRMPLNTSTIPGKIQLMQSAADAFGAAGSKRELGDCLRLLADLRTWKKLDERALPELDSAKQLYQQAKSGDWQQLYIIYSRYYAMEENYKKSLEAILNALRITAATDSSAEVAEMDHHAGILFFRMKDYKQSVVFLNKALTLAEKMKDVSDSYETAFTLVRAYSALGEPKKSLKLMNNLESRYPIHEGDDAFELDLCARLAVYNDLKQYKAGHIYFDYLVKFVGKKGPGDERQADLELIEMIPFCIGTGQYTKAEQLLRTKENITKILGAKLTTRIVNLNMWLALDTTKKDFRAATIHLLKLRELNDSLFNETQTRQLREMEVQYQTEKKETENLMQGQRIQMLTAQQNLQRAELKTAGVVRNVLLTGGFCILIIAGLIYMQYAQGRKNNAMIAEKNSRLEHLLNENQWLLKEVHHRVKNNLQVITALLNSQSAYLEDGAALDAILKSKGRVESIALIHQKLYKANNYSSIFMPEYIQDLVKYLKDSFLEDQNIWFDLNIDPVSLDVGDAVPVGLIINESVTNAIKHAFTSKSDNVIGITLKKEGPGLILTVRDNGRGFIENEPTKSSSFGLLLMTGLADELNGTLEQFNSDGTVIRVHLKSLTTLPGFVEKPGK
jgi:two-component system, sensor histidine kinase PdtaS